MSTPMPDDGTDARSTSALRLHNLSKSFNGTTVLRGADLVVERGEIHALVGENGSGKSTLIKVLAGFHKPDAGATAEVGGRELELGSATSARDLGCRFVHQDLGLVSTLSVLDNLMLGNAQGYPVRWGTIKRTAARAQARAMLDRIDLDADLSAPVWSLPIAEQTGVAIARALRDDGDRPASLLVLDEPTASLPFDEVQRLHELVRSAADHGVGVVYVTHRLEEIFQLTDRVTVLRDGVVVGDHDTVDLDHDSLVDLLVGKSFSLSRLAGEAPLAEPVLSIAGLSAGKLSDFSLLVSPGEIVGLAGITGSGRESVLPAVFGGMPRRAGVVEVGNTAVPPVAPHVSMRNGIGYLPPDRATLGALLEMTGEENLTFGDLRPFSSFFFLSASKERAETQNWFERLDVRPLRAALEHKISVLSGGNQQKVLIGKWLRLQPRVLLLDEPTQGVDIGAKAQIHAEVAAAAESGAAVVVASTDIEELVSLCHRVLVIAHGSAFVELAGNDVNNSNLVKAILRSSAGDHAERVPELEGRIVR